MSDWRRPVRAALHAHATSTARDHWNSRSADREEVGDGLVAGAAVTEVPASSARVSAARCRKRFDPETYHEPPRHHRHRPAEEW